jgi:hypothetical protein
MNKTQLREQWEKACNDYMKELLRVWELDTFYAYWVGEDVGGVLDYDGAFSISMEEIIFCVENDVTEDQYEEWQNYICDAAEFGFSTPNLKSWMKGCPRTPPEVFARLRAMKKDLADAVEEEKLRQSKPSRFI